MGDKQKEKSLPESRAATFVASSPAKGKTASRNGKPATPSKPTLTDMSGDGKKDLRSEARSFCDSLSNVFLLKKRDPQTKHLLEKAQNIINSLLADPTRAAPATPSSKASRAGSGMGQLWVKLDELKRENDDLRRQRGRSSEERAGSPKSPKSPKPQPGPAEPPLLEYNRLKQDNESLSQQVDKLHKNIKEHQTIASNLQDECKRYKSALEAAQKLAKKAREDVKNSDTSLASMKAENETLKHKLASHASSSQTPSAKPNVASSKPSTPPARPSAPNSKPSTPPIKPPSSSSPSKSPNKSPKPRMRTDNRHSENIGERCRPSSIAVAYTTLESQQWMDAKEALEDGDYEEEEIVKFLCDVIMTSYGTSSHVLQSVEKIIAQIIACPTLAVHLESNLPSNSSSSKLPEEISDMICQRLRANYDKIDTTTLAKLTRDNQSKTSQLHSQWSQESLQCYVKECGAVSWQMAIQKPPMKLGDKYSSYDDSKHRLWWSCNQAKARKVDYTIWPALYDYDGGNLMVKGCVYAS